MAGHPKTLAALRLANSAKTGAGEEGQKWWNDEPVTKQQVQDLALQQMYAYLSRPNTRETTRIKMIQLALRIDPKGEGSSELRKQFADLVTQTKAPKVEEEPQPDAT